MTVRRCEPAIFEILVVYQQPHGAGAARWGHEQPGLPAFFRHAHFGDNSCVSNDLCRRGANYSPRSQELAQFGE